MACLPAEPRPVDEAFSVRSNDPTWYRKVWAFLTPALLGLGFAQFGATQMTVADLVGKTGGMDVGAVLAFPLAFVIPLMAVVLLQRFLPPLEVRPGWASLGEVVASLVGLPGFFLPIVLLMKAAAIAAVLPGLLFPVGLGLGLALVRAERPEEVA
ncbi:MAG: hypothetical protein JWM80_4175 [Cyanobacteria bacterium RYN_339]|nr:hypothetical protein [Cyanobacteria bacterium RYN_339]